MRSVFNTPLLTPVLRAIARAGLRLAGWRIEPGHELRPPFVYIGAPHTSNWDFMLMLAMALDQGLQTCWLGKHTLFRAPFGPVMRWLGGIPVDRRQTTNLVSNTAAFLRAHPEQTLCIAPEGTRSKVRHWRTGFYHIALQAGVPILATVIDADARIVRVRGWHHPTGNADEEIAAIQRLYQEYRGLIPANGCDLREPPEA